MFIDENDARGSAGWTGRIDFFPWALLIRDWCSTGRTMRGDFHHVLWFERIYVHYGLVEDVEPVVVFVWWTGD